MQKGHGVPRTLPEDDPQKTQWKGLDTNGICLSRQCELLPTSGPLPKLFPLLGALHHFCLTQAYVVFSWSLNSLP